MIGLDWAETCWFLTKEERKRMNTFGLASCSSALRDAREWPFRRERRAWTREADLDGRGGSRYVLGVTVGANAMVRILVEPEEADLARTVQK